ncbi:metallophosphoesterase family protein [Paenirhodobacter sp.]|uniref:metallophosphoesterase family protein n=1 Tax=Paenirhodobacter sp. TaxID=1965326 RepID=UPI003B4258C8
MRLAVLSDIHANREAFAAVLEDAARQGVDGFVLLGDIVGYGPDPEWCTDRATEMAEAGAICVQGNHDAAIAAPEPMNATARAVIDWTRPRLNDAQRAFLAGLPLSQRVEDVLFVHASAHAPGDWIYMDGPGPAAASLRMSDAAVILCGHTHRPALYSNDLRGAVHRHDVPIGTALPLLRSRRWIAVLGAVGQPRDGVPQAGYAILNTTAREITYRRVPYDSAATIAKLRAAGLPDALAQRLREGL